ncbi:MAG TPA: ATP-binding cassette domain-containing protein [Actinomycetota bacterium]|nr:ATP-binding cassette domain-containing protein [Actinomycetota bacterium]
MPAIEAEDLTKAFDVRGPRGRRSLVEAVRGITFSVEQGERLAYIGPNGAGKSTSIKILTGILHPTKGSARVLGFVPWKERRALVRSIGVLFGQRSQLWFELSPRQSFDLLARIYGLDPSAARHRVEELAGLLESHDLFDVPVRNLSLGQRMRCELAASVLHDPKVLFLDEPTIGLDLVAKQRFRDMVVRLNEERGTTIFLTSHDVSDIEQVARRVIVINGGTIIYDDKVSRMRRAVLSTKLLEVRFEEPPPSLDLDGVEVLKESGTGYKLVVDTERRSIREVLDALLDGYRVADISVMDPPLEEVIAKIYEARL